MFTILLATAHAAPRTDYIAFCSTTPDMGVLAVSLLVRMPEKLCSTTRIREVVSPASPGLGMSSIYLGFVYLRQGERRGFDFGPRQDDDIANGEGPADSACEGVLHYRFRPGQGAAIQGICSPSCDYDHTYQVQHGDTVAVPSGFRRKAPASDCDLYILWARAGAGVSSIQPGGCPG